MNASLRVATLLTESDPNAAQMAQALQADACPICMLTAASTQRFIDGFLYESVNDATLREELARAQGFCYRHAWQVLDADRYGGVGVTILYLDFTTRAIEALRAHLRYAPIVQRLSWWRRALGFLRRRAAPHARITALEPRALCLVCRVEREAEAGYLADLARLLARADFRARYTESRGMCLPHLRQMFASVDAETRLFLAETTRTKIATLLHHIQEYNRKHIWDFRAEPKLPEEQDAWIRAIAFQVGEKK
jgi:hypothetical protein